MGEMELYSRLHTLSGSSTPLFVGDGRAQELALHKIWLQGIRRERPSTEKHFKIGVYIRYFNQTKHSDYLSYHKKQFRDTIELCLFYLGRYIHTGFLLLRGYEGYPFPTRSQLEAISRCHHREDN